MLSRIFKKCLREKSRRVITLVEGPHIPPSIQHTKRSLKRCLFSALSREREGETSMVPDGGYREDKARPFLEVLCYETGTTGSKYNLELRKVNFPFHLFIYYQKGRLDKSLGTQCWTRQPSEVPANLKYFMILWNLIEMPGLHYCISCVGRFNQTTKENTPNIWDSKHIHTNNKRKEKNKANKTKILQNP